MNKLTPDELEQRLQEIRQKKRKTRIKYETWADAEIAARACHNPADNSWVVYKCPKPSVYEHYHFGRYAGELFTCHGTWYVKKDCYPSQQLPSPLTPP